MEHFNNGEHHGLLYYIPKDKNNFNPKLSEEIKYKNNNINNIKINEENSKIKKEENETAVNREIKENKENKENMNNENKINNKSNEQIELSNDILNEIFKELDSENN